MDRIIFCCIISLLLIRRAYTQTTNYIKQPAIGIHFFYNDIKTAKEHKLASLKDMDAGFAISFIKGLSNYIDFSTGLSASFPAKAVAGNNGTEKNRLLLEWDAMLYTKMLNDKHFISPYLSAGVGISKYAGYYAAFVPAGVGVQVNILNQAFVLVNAQYRLKVLDNTVNHFYYSIGVAGNLGKEKPVKVIAPPPVPFKPQLVDSDGDGIADTLDACPDLAGPGRLKGCPDKDNDGIADKEDKCPDVPGVARYQGCPVPDTDSDGINDEEDKCPSVAGVARNMGCPVKDTDNDGVNDEEDKCPDVAGSITNSGCPEVSEIIQLQVVSAARHIFFGTGSTQLLPASYTSLNTIAKLLSDDDALKLDINGYTDNAGTPANNQVLSRQRAEAVKNYLVNKGVNANRLVAIGYGAERPVADNKTSEGRAKNRRVDLKLKY